MKKIQAFTLIELLVVISIIALLIAILLPALGAARKSARQMRNSANLRSLHQAMMIYGQDNKGYYTGLNSDGTVMTPQQVERAANVPSGQLWGNGGEQVVPRFALLAFSDVLAFEHLVNPEELGSGREVWDELDRFSHRYVSYAILGITEIENRNGKRVGNAFNEAIKSWNSDSGSNTPIFSDRNTTTNNRNPGASLWNEEQWEGGLQFNDGHGTFENDVLIEGTRLGKRTNEEDELFDAGNVTGLPGGPYRVGWHASMVKRAANQTIGSYVQEGITP